MFTRMSKALGPKGDYLAFCRSIGMVPFPVSVPIFGKVATIPEILNLHDNFAVGELRDSHIETVLSKAANPVVVDCGVNVGITVRWWFHLNPSCRVFGLDMMKEAHDLTGERLRGSDAAYIGITAALSSLDGEEVTIHFTDPLEGTNRTGSIKHGAVSRTLITARIDSLLAPHSLSRIELLKIDIEGCAAKALAGACRTLSGTQNVILEAHSEDELGESEAILVESGFRLRHFRNRNVWFKRA
jgi:FkbM family methyltransferase